MSNCGQDFHVRSYNGWFYIESPNGKQVYAGHMTERQVGEWFRQWAIDCQKEQANG